jgi:hypothetical protein
VLVEVGQVAEVPRVEAVPLDVLERPLDLALPLGLPGWEGARPEPVVGRERQEPRLVD